MNEKEKIQKLRAEKLYFKKLARALVDEIHSRDRRRIGNRISDEFEGKFMCDEWQKLGAIINDYKIK